MQDIPANTGNCLPDYMVLQPHDLQYESSVPQNVTAFFSKIPYTERRNMSKFLTAQSCTCITPPPEITLLNCRNMDSAKK